MKSSIILTLLLLLSGCKGGNDYNLNGTLPETLFVSVHGGPAPGIQKLVLETTRVEVRRSGSDTWFDLHQGGVESDLIEPLLSNPIAWTSNLPPAGTYNALRIQFGSGSRITATDGGYAGPLALPPDLFNGLVVPVNFTVGNGGMTFISLVFDTLMCLQVQESGSASPYLFRPTFRVIRNQNTNGFEGTQGGLVWKGNASTPLPSAMVTAQVPHTPDPPEILEGGITSTSHTQWNLVYLPLGQPICLVAAHTGSDVCLPKAATINLHQIFNTWIEFTLDTVPLAGSAHGRVTPVPGPDQADLILVLQDLEVAPGRTEQLIVARVLPTWTTEETFTCPSLAPGSYRLCVVRRSFGADGSEQSRAHGWSTPFLVEAGQVASQDLAF